MTTTVRFFFVCFALLPATNAAQWPSEEYVRRQNMIYDAVDVAPLPLRQTRLRFEYREKSGHYLFVEWRTGNERESSKEEMESFRLVCLDITRKLVAKLPNELRPSLESEIGVGEGKFFREFSPVTFVRHGVIPVHFKKDAQ